MATAQITYARSLTPGHDRRPIRECDRCASEIVWVKSQRTGKFYPANVTTWGVHDARRYGPFDVHTREDCEARQAAGAEFRAQVIAEEAERAVAPLIDAVLEAEDAGAIDRAERDLHLDAIRNRNN